MPEYVVTVFAEERPGFVYKNNEIDKKYFNNETNLFETAFKPESNPKMKNDNGTFVDIFVSPPTPNKEFKKDKKFVHWIENTKQWLVEWNDSNFINLVNKTFSFTTEVDGLEGDGQSGTYLHLKVEKIPQVESVDSNMPITPVEEENISIPNGGRSNKRKHRKTTTRNNRRTYSSNKSRRYKRRVTRKTRK